MVTFIVYEWQLWINENSKCHTKNSCAYLQHYFKNWHFIEWTQTHIHTKVILCLYSFFCSILFSLSVSFYCWNNSLFNYKLFVLKNYHYKLNLFYIDFLLPCILLKQLKLIYLICSFSSGVINSLPMHINYIFIIWWN